MTFRFGMRAAMRCALTSMLFATAIAALSAPGPAKAASVIGGLYYDNGSVNCSNSVGACSLTLKKIPAGKDVIINRVSCKITITTNAEILGLEFSRVLANGSSFHYGQFLTAPTAVGTLNGNTIYNLNSEVLVGFEENMAPRVTVIPKGAQPTLQFFCTISGTQTP